jgi:hypothetical protein
MRKRLDIKINDPCGENWQDFQKDGSTAYCQNCQKHVIDFTTKSDEEIFEYFNRDRGKVCGRLTEAQLRSYYSKRESSALNKAAIITAGMLTLGRISESSPLPNKLINPIVEINNRHDRQLCTNKVQDSHSTDALMIRGKVISDDDGTLLSGVNVIIKGTAIGTTTDLNGEFKLLYNSYRGDPIILVFSFIGLQTTEYGISDNTKEIEIGSVVMKTDVILLGEVCTIRWWTQRGIWSGIKNVFTRR